LQIQQKVGTFYVRSADQAGYSSGPDGGPSASSRRRSELRRVKIARPIKRVSQRFGRSGGADHASSSQGGAGSSRKIVLPRWWNWQTCLPDTPWDDSVQICPSGGIGRRARFRAVWPQGRRSSTLLLGTRLIKASGVAGRLDSGASDRKIVQVPRPPDRRRRSGGDSCSGHL